MKQETLDLKCCPLTWFLFILEGIGKNLLVELVHIILWLLFTTLPQKANMLGYGTFAELLLRAEGWCYLHHRIDSNIRRMIHVPAE